MTFAAAIRADFPTSSSNHASRVCSSRLGRRQKRLAWGIPKGRGHFKLGVSSVSGNRKPSLNDNGATEPTRFLLESLFAQTQKLDEQMSRDSSISDNIQVVLNLKNLELDLHATMVALKKKEEDLQDAERMVLLEHDELKHAKEDLEQREKEIAVIAYKQEQLEDALKDANLNLASKTRQIEELKLQIKERDHYIAVTQSALDLKQHELDSMRIELVTKGEELTSTTFELASKAHLLNEANEVIKNQDIEIQELHKMVQEKQRELKMFWEGHMQDEEKLKVAEANLKNRTMEYLVAHEEMKKMSEETSRNMEETNKALAEFGGAKNLLANVRSELVASQKSLSSSRENMKSQELQLEGQLAELEKQKASITSYFRSLKGAHVEVESERVKFRVAVARNRELEAELSSKRKIMEDLEEELKKEKLCLQRTLHDMSILKEEFGRKSKELEEAYSSLELKDSELVDAKLEIQHLQSKQSSLNLFLNEKDAELLSASRRLEEVIKEVVELKMLVSSKEDQLTQASIMLKDKDAHLQVMQHELNESKLKYVDAENAIQRLVELTNELVVSTEDEDCQSEESEVKFLQQSTEKETSFSESNWEKKQLEAEIGLARENLRTREMEVLASQRALAIKDEQLNLVREHLDAREQELRTAKDEIALEAYELRKLHISAQDRIGSEKSIGDLAIEKLQQEATQLDAEAAFSALFKLAELSGELLNTSGTSTLDEYDIEPACKLATPTSYSSGNPVDLSGVKTEVARLTALTERLMQEAGIVGSGCM